MTAHGDNAIPSAIPPVSTAPSTPSAGPEAWAAFAELGRIDLADNDLAQVLARVAALAKDVIPGASEVSITLLSAGVAGTSAYTGDVALALDERQYDAGSGPCLEAATELGVLVVADVAAERRWPRFTADAASRGILSMLALGIPIRDAVTGAVNVYADRAGAFGEHAVDLATRFADYATVALANAHLYDTTAALAGQLAEAMSSRAVIEQAKGIVMAQQQVDADGAFEVLSRASQASNRKLRDLAQALVDGAGG